MTAPPSEKILLREDRPRFLLLTVADVTRPRSSRMGTGRVEDFPGSWLVMVIEIPDR